MSFPLPDVSHLPLNELLSLRGRKAVITGGAQGLGFAVASRFAEAGANVVLADVKLDIAENSAAELAEKFGIRALAVKTDVTDAQAVVALADRTVETLGGIDIWVNNAGIFPA